MKRMFLLLLLATPAFAGKVPLPATIDQTAVLSIKQCSDTLFDCVMDLKRFVNGATVSFGDLAIAGTDIKVVIPQEVKDQLTDTATYQTKLQACTDVIATCP